MHCRHISLSNRKRPVSKLSSLSSMALSALHLFLFTLSLFSISSSSARPCKSFFYTTTTIQDPSPNFNILPFDDTYASNSPNVITFFFNPINIPDDLPDQPSIDYFSLRRYPYPRFITNNDEEEEENHDFMPMGFYPRMARNSVRNRVKDIMSVVGAMLFGVGCGALTAATMYFVWSLFYPDRFDVEDESDSDGSDGGDDDDDVKSKKVRYVIIPDDDIDAIKKAAQAQAKAMSETA